jgi:hypothetical protein
MKSACGLRTVGLLGGCVSFVADPVSRSWFDHSWFAADELGGE